MRINQFVAKSTGLSRRKADDLVLAGEITINGQTAKIGDNVGEGDVVVYNGKNLSTAASNTLVMLNKPVGYVCSRNGQGSKTIYDLLPSQLHNLKPVGRLDKDSSGLLLLTDDGKLANRLTHPSFQKEKVYEIEIDKPLPIEHKNSIENGVKLSDGISRLKLKGASRNWIVTMSEGRNRQIRRTFQALSYKVIKLHRTKFGPYYLNIPKSGSFISTDIN